MPFDAMAQRPDRMSIANLATAESVELQYNPTELEETIGAVYNRQTVLGMSHQILQFSHTENLSISFDLAFDALTNAESFDADDCLNARRFIHALCYPRAGAALVADGAPPRALFVWPHLYTLTCVITKARFRFTRFFGTGKPSAFKCSLSIEEIRDFRVTSEELMADGTQRADSGGPR